MQPILISTCCRSIPAPALQFGTPTALSQRVADLATDLTSNTMYVAATASGGQASLHRIDPDTGSTELVGELSTFNANGLAINQLGEVFVTAIDPTTNAPVLHRIDPIDGSTLATVRLGNAFRVSGSFAGLGYRATVLVR